MLFISIGVGLGFASGFIPGFSSKNLALLLIAYGLISSNIYLAVTIVAVEISASFFEFLSPILFSVGNEATVLAIDPENAELTEESLRRRMSFVVSGGLTGIVLSLPLLFIGERIFPFVYDTLKPLVGWMLLFICTYIIWIERGWKKKIFASVIFCLSGLFGLLVKDSGLVSSEYLLLPIFIGLYGFSSIISKRHEDPNSSQYTHEMAVTEKIRAAAVAFITTLFASLIPGMKRGQTSAVALQISGTAKNEEVLFMISLVSLAFVTLSIFALGSSGKIRSTLAYDINEVMGQLQFSQTVLFAGSAAISACMSACILTFLAKPTGRFFSKINKKYLNIFGFCIGSFLIIIFTGINGVLLAFAATCIGILSSRLKIRSAHLMGVLLVPSIIGAIL